MKWVYILFYIAISSIILAPIVEYIFNLGHKSFIIRLILGVGLTCAIGVFVLWFKFMKIGIVYGHDVLKDPTKKEKRQYKIDEVLEND